MVVVVNVGTIDVGVGLVELGAIFEIAFPVSHNFVFDLLVLAFSKISQPLQLEVLAVDLFIELGETCNVGVQLLVEILVLCDLLAMEYDGTFKLLDAVVDVQ